MLFINKLNMNHSRALTFIHSLRKYYKHKDQLQLDVGAFANALEFACDIKSEVVGKPCLSFFSAALSDIGITPEEVSAYSYHFISVLCLFLF